jgi:tRNA1(Val) A37 N6-methylase TrmN6
VGSSQLLKEKGKIAFVLPAELLQVSYAQQLREFFSSFLQ